MLRSGFSKHDPEGGGVGSKDLNTPFPSYANLKSLY